MRIINNSEGLTRRLKEQKRNDNKTTGKKGERPIRVVKKTKNSKKTRI